MTRFDVLEHSLRKMTQYCGPLSIESICSGLRHTLSRTNYPVPSPKVMKKILETRNYSIEDNLYYWDGDLNEELSRGEMILFDLLSVSGPVIHHSEMAQVFIDSELSFPSLHATLTRSPLIEKISQALYKLRGQKVSFSDIEQAKNKKEKTPVNLSVRYDKSGKIILEASLGILAVGTGVLFSESIPNLDGNWGCIAENSKYDDIIVTENEIKRLLPVFQTLSCEVGDRVQFTFDAWERVVYIRKLDL